MEQFKKGGVSRTGRKHFTRRVVKADTDYSTSRSFFDEPAGEGRSYGPRKSFSGRPEGPRPYGSRPDGPRKPYGSRSEGGHSDGPHKPYGSWPDGPRKSSGPRPDGPRKSYGSRSEEGRGEAPRGGRSSAPRGGKPGAPRRKFDERSIESRRGIRAMVDRKPQVSNVAFSDDDTVKTPIKEVIRLNKFIANSGVCSRREADMLIQSGVVTVNGEVVTELGTKVNVLTDDVRFNGERLKGEAKVYIVMNKPAGYVTTASDPHAERTVMDLLAGCPTRVFPVGRLDKNTTGVLMLTNDGEIAERLTHPSYNKKKIYQVVLDHPISDEDFRKILEGVELPDGVIAADELEYLDERDHRQLGIEIHSGKNRVVRRIFESLDYDVRALDRVYFAGLTKKGLKKGDWRYLTEGEVNILKMGAYV